MSEMYELAEVGGDEILRELEEIGMGTIALIVLILVAALSHAATFLLGRLSGLRTAQEIYERKGADAVMRILEQRADDIDVRIDGAAKRSLKEADRYLARLKSDEL